MPFSSPTKPYAIAVKAVVLLPCLVTRVSQKGDHHVLRSEKLGLKNDRFAPVPGALEEVHFR